jgi:septal ring-binding cell division protein DamX
LGEYGRRLARTESVVEEAADRVERLALEQESLAADLNELRRSFEELEPATPAMPASPSGSRQDTVGLPGTRWLQQQDPGHYTIQVVAGPYPQGIENVARGFVQTGPLAHYRRLHDGRDWHVLLYGNFATLGGAREALGALSKEIHSYGPWIRSFRSVQADLQQP